MKNYLKVTLKETLFYWQKSSFKTKKTLKLITFALFLFFSFASLFSCGLANYIPGSSGSDVTILNSRDEESKGEFNSASGRLESSDTCSKSDDCIELCNSMLERFSLQKKCYEYKEVEVQSFRDTYNLLALGNPRKLARVDTDEMEKFLTFGPELWRDAIYGFERERKEDCTPNDGSGDPTEREDCKREGYYKQVGYWSEGATFALEWIAKNDWLAELINEHDEDLVIMTSLLEVLSSGGGRSFGSTDRDQEPETQTAGVSQYRSKTCNFNNLIEPIDGNDNSTCQKDGDSGRCEDLDMSGVCNGEGDTIHGRLNPNKDFRLRSSADLSTITCHKTGGVDNYGSVSVKFEDYYKAFGADCVKDGDDRENYFMIAVEERNKHSVNLGHQVVEKLCGGVGDNHIKCVRYFYCHIKNGYEDRNTSSTTDNAPEEGTVLHYIYDNTGDISNWKSISYNTNCKNGFY